MSALFWLSETQWAAIEPHLPTNQPARGGSTISGIVHVLKVGCRWCDCPARRLRWKSGARTKAIGPSRAGQTTKIHALTDVVEGLC